LKKPDSRKRVYEGKILNIELDQVTLPNGHKMEIELIQHPGAAAIVPLMDDGSVVMIYQYRYSAGGYLYEIPAGKLDLGEEPLACARRELKEETGYDAKKIRPLLSFLTTPGFCDEVIYLFLAEELIPGVQDLEESEDIEVKRIPLDQTLEMIRTGQIRDGKTIIGLQNAYLSLNR
jgi:ADP-ribose pyrophosphatase